MAIVNSAKTGFSQIPHTWLTDDRLSLLELGLLVKATIFNSLEQLTADFWATQATRYAKPAEQLEVALINLERYGYLEAGSN